MSMKTSRVLTAAQLVAAGACHDQVALFRATFGSRVTVTPGVFAEHAHQFEWGWGARHLLSAPALAGWERARASAWADYQRTVASALADYERAVAPAWADYERAVAPAWADYQRARASAFELAYIDDEAAT